MIKFSFIPSLLLLAVWTTPTQAQIVDLSVANNSFEQPVLSGSGDYVAGSGSVPDWTINDGTVGVQNGERSDLYGNAGSGLDGSNFAFDDSTGAFWQNLTSDPTIQAGTYTLTVAVGDRPGVAVAGAYLYLNDTLANNLASSGLVGESADGDGKFTDYSVTLNVPEGSPEIGRYLSIVLAGANNKGVTGVTNADFDDVRLTYEALPEPPTFVLMAAGVALLGAARWRRAFCF